MLSNPWSHLFNEFLEGSGDQWTSTQSPATNIKEVDDKYSIELLAPGMEKEDFEIKIEKDQLVISSKQEEEHTESDSDGTVIRSEFSIRSFSRSFHLSEEIDTDKVNAVYDKGILRVDLPKKAEIVENHTKIVEIS